MGKSVLVDALELQGNVGILAAAIGCGGASATSLDTGLGHVNTQPSLDVAVVPECSIHSPAGVCKCVDPVRYQADLEV